MTAFQVALGFGEYSVLRERRACASLFMHESNENDPKQVRLSRSSSRSP